MIVRTVRLTSKGQLSLPVDTLRALKIGEGSELLLVQEGDRILLLKAEQVGRREVEDLGGWSTLSAAAFSKVWDNEADEIWNEA